MGSNDVFYINSINKLWFNSNVEIVQKYILFYCL